MLVSDLMEKIAKGAKVYITCVFGDIWQGSAKDFDESAFWYSPFQYVDSVESTENGEIIITATANEKTTTEE